MLLALPFVFQSTLHSIHKDHNLVMTVPLGGVLEYVWTKSCQEAFEEVKKKLTTTPILITPN